MIRYYSLHDLIKVKSNINIGIPSGFTCGYQHDVDLSYMKEDFDFVPIDDKNKSRGKDFFFWEELPRKLIFNYKSPLLNTKLMIDDLCGRTQIKLTKDLTNYGRVGIGIKSLLQLKLLQKDAMLIHAGSIETENGASLIVAARESGKTSVILSLLGDYIKFISDNLTIVSKKHIAYSYPEDVIIPPQMLSGKMFSDNKDFKSKILKSNFLTSFMDKTFNIEIEVKKRIPTEFTADHGRIKNVFILAGGDVNTIYGITPQEATEKILISTIGIINPLNEYLLTFYSYVYNYNLFDIYEKMKRIVYLSICHADCYVICTNNIDIYTKMIKSNS